MRMKTKDFISVMLKQDPEAKKGKNIYRMFLPDSSGFDRSSFDGATDFIEESWSHHGTPQDANYYGQWYNDEKRMLLSYSEGDWILKVCSDRQSYLIEFEAMEKFHADCC